MFIDLTNEDKSFLEIYDRKLGVLENTIEVFVPKTKIWLEDLQNVILSSSISIFDIPDGFILKISTKNKLMTDVGIPIFDVPSDVILEIKSFIE